jgi:hypothetical protein
MKNIFCNYLIIAAIAVSAAFTSCKKDDDKNGDDGQCSVALLYCMQAMFPDPKHGHSIRRKYGAVLRW